MSKIPTRERTAILQSLAAGVVPAVGLHHIQVGRQQEIMALMRDLKVVQDGAASVRFIVGRYGSGKTFFLKLVAEVALKQKFVVVQADITTDRRLYGKTGEAQSLYRELMHNMATRACPTGGALQKLVERWVTDVDHEIQSAGGTTSDVRKQLTERLRPLQDLVSGYDFATVLTKYYDGFQEHDELLQEHAIQWLRAEFKNRTEARQALGVRTIIDDVSYYDYLKLLAAFVRIAGYSGLLVNIDECVVISHRLTNTMARNKNYEAILRIINDCIQRPPQGLAFLFAGTDEFVEDRRRGLFSYEALATRLAPGRFATDGRIDLAAPIIKLPNLTREECFVLLRNIRHVHAGGNDETSRLPEEGIEQYLEDCHNRLGADFYKTPRDTVREFVNLLNVLEDNPKLSWQELLTSASYVSPVSCDAALDASGPEDELSGFTLS